MLDAFEAALTDLLADAVAGPPPAGAPRIAVLPRAGAAAPADAQVTAAVTLGEAKPDPEFGDDAPVARRETGGWRERPEIWLTGSLALALSAVDGDAAERRTRLLRAADRLLVALDAGEVRVGRALDDGDRGFHITALRLTGIAVPEDPADATRLTLAYQYRGRFWPVGAEVDGGVITRPEVRIAVLPLTRPERVMVRAGQGPVPIGLRGSLQALNGTVPALLARLGGVAPGTLTGSGDPAPAGFVVSVARPDGSFPLAYQPPATVDGPLRADIELRLGGDERSVVIDRLPIEVLAP